MSIIRDNLMTQKGYSPYCGSIGKRCSMPRTTFTGTQFKCNECGWVDVELEAWTINDEVWRML